MSDVGRKHFNQAVACAVVAGENNSLGVKTAMIQLGQLHADLARIAFEHFPNQERPGG